MASSAGLRQKEKEDQVTEDDVRPPRFSPRPKAANDSDKEPSPKKRKSLFMDKEAEVPGGVESCPEPTPVNPLWEIPDAVDFTAAEVAAAVKG